MPEEMKPLNGYRIPEDFDEYEDDEHNCCTCGGRGYMITCIDDLCHGQDECMHGDPPSPCRECNPKAEKEDSYL